MSWTYGFFNSVDGDRTYNADQMSAIFNGLITDGVYEAVGNKLAVAPSSGMTVQIKDGRGWFNGRWVNNDAPYLIELEAADSTLSRYAAVGVRVNNTDRSAVPFVKYGALSSSPAFPTMTRDLTVKEYCLGYVLISPKATGIISKDIVDARPDTSVCGWVTGLIDQVDTATLWSQWEALFNEFMADSQSEFSMWMASLDDYIDDNMETKLANDILSLQNRVIKSSGTFNGLGWDSQGDGTYTQTVEVEGVTPLSQVFIYPNDKAAYVAQGVEAINHGIGTITFSCDDPDDINMTVDVIILKI